MRTNIVIDEKLMRETLRLTGLKTKREAVDPAPIPRTSDSCSFYAALKVRG
jgi:hypothetical protein